MLLIDHYVSSSCHWLVHCGNVLFKLCHYCCCLDKTRQTGRHAAQFTGMIGAWVFFRVFGLPFCSLSCLFFVNTCTVASLVSSCLLIKALLWARKNILLVCLLTVLIQHHGQPHKCQKWDQFRHSEECRLILQDGGRQRDRGVAGCG